MLKQYRINKFIAESTGCSRREAEQFVTEGFVVINGTKITDLSTKVTSKDNIILKGKKLKLTENTYIIFNKPSGYITTREDEKGRKTIYDLLPKKLHNLKPVGRLDKDSSGLIILTNNGDLINTLTHPKFHIPKKYKVRIKGKFNQNHADNFLKGIDIGNNDIAKAEVISAIQEKNGCLEVVMILEQGLNRQIRRMMEKIGSEVVSLKRVSIGPVTLKGLKRGEYSYLTRNEVENFIKYLAKTSDLL